MPLNSQGLGITITARDQASGTFNRVGRNLGTLASRAADTRATLSQAGNEMRMVGRRMMLAGAVGFAALGGASIAANKYGRAVAEIASISDKAEMPMEKIRAITSQMSTLYEGDLTMQAKALYQAVSAGATTAAGATNLMHAANQLAIAGVADTEQAIDSLTNTINAYGLEQKDSAAIADAFFTAVRVGKTTIPEISRYMGQVTPTAAAAGIGIDHMSASIAALTAQGIRTRIAVTSMKAAIANVIKPSQEAAKYAKELGINFSVAGLKEAGGFPNFLELVRQKTGGGITEMGKLFGSLRGLNAVMALTSEAGGKKFAGALDAMKNKAGEANRAYKLMSNTTQFLADLLKSNLMVAVTKVGEAMEPVVRVMVKAATKIAATFAALPTFMHQAFAGSIAFVSGLLLVGGALVVVAGMLIMLIAIGKAALLALAAVAQILQVLVVVMAAVALAAAGFYLAIKRNIGGFGTYVQEKIHQVKLVFRGLQEMFTSGTMSSALKKELEKAENQGVARFLNKIWEFGMRVTAFWEGVKQGFYDVIDAMGPTFKTLEGSIDRVGKAFGFAEDASKDFSKELSGAGASGRSVGQTIANAFELMVRAISGTLDFVAGFAQGFSALGGTTYLLGVAFDQFVDSFNEVSKAFGASGVSKEISGWQAFGAVLGFVVDILGILVAILAVIASTAFALVASAVRNIVGIFSGVATAIGGVIDIVHGIFTGRWGMVWKGALKVVLGFVQSVTSMISTLIEPILVLIDSVGKLFGKDIGSVKMFRSVKDFVISPLAEAAGETVARGPGAAVEQRAARLAGATKEKPTGPPTPAVALPGAAAAAAGAGGADRIVSAINASAKQQPPVAVNLKSELTMDAEKMAEALQSKIIAGGNRQFGPTPTET